MLRSLSIESLILGVNTQHSSRLGTPRASSASSTVPVSEHHMSVLCFEGPVTCSWAFRTYSWDEPEATCKRDSPW